MNKSLLTAFFLVIAICSAGRVPLSKQNVRKQVFRPFMLVDPLTARSLLNNDFENGIEDPWYDSSPNTVHWVVEDFSSPTASYTPPAPLKGTKYLRATRDEQLTPGLLILRTVVFTALPGDVISFDFWIRSKYTGGNTLEVRWAVLTLKRRTEKMINVWKWICIILNFVLARCVLGQCRNNFTFSVQLFHIGEFRMASNFQPNSRWFFYPTNWSNSKLSFSINSKLFFVFATD